MRSTSVLACTLLFAAIISARIALAQSSPDGAASDDIFELLTPLAASLNEVEIDAAPTPAIEPTPAVRPTPIEIDTARRGATAPIQEADASRSPIDLSPEVPGPPTQTNALTQQVRLLLAPAPSASGNADSPGRPPLLVEKPGLLTRLSRDELRTLLAQATTNCQRDLEGIQYGQRWLNFLNLEQLQQHLAAPADVAAIEPIRKRFGAVTADDKYDVITKRPSFEAVHLVLNEFAASADDRRRRREAFDSLQDLNAALRPTATGHQWLAFFKLADLERLLTLPRRAPQTTSHSSRSSWPAFNRRPSSRSLRP